MGPRDRQYSIRPKAPTLLALLVFALALSVAVPALRKPEREGWIALPPQPMDASDPDIRQLLTKSEQLTLPREIEGEGSLSERCGEDDTEAEAIPAGQVSAPPSSYDPSPTPPPSPPPMPEQRYIAVLGHGPLGGRETRRIQIDIDGGQARIRVRDGDVSLRFQPPPALEARQPRYAERRVPLAALAPLRDAWSAPELWTAGQRSAAWCADNHGLREAFFEACVYGRYYARDRACDRAAQEPLAQLWTRIVELAPPPPPGAP